MSSRVKNVVCANELIAPVIYLFKLLDDIASKIERDNEILNELLTKINSDDTYMSTYKNRCNLLEELQHLSIDSPLETSARFIHVSDSRISNYY